MNKKNLIDHCIERGLIVQFTEKRKLIKRIISNPITLYCGFDPTADSLHLGHLIPILCLKRFQKAGHTPIVLIGGATALIGDPSFKFVQRKLNNFEKIFDWIEKIQQQISCFLDFKCGNNSAKIVNNYDWFSKMDLLFFLREIGKYFSINKMVHKKAIKKRFDQNKCGISFSELSYNLLQSYDFLQLYRKNKVELQIGGSDQWGNIISGIDLIHRIYKEKVFGFTLPLITKSDGTKFSKTENDVIWLDPKKTSPYKFYQFWINISDEDIYRFFKFFTFVSLEDINELKCRPEYLNKPQLIKHVLAKKVTKLVHGLDYLKSVERIVKSLFFNKFEKLKKIDFVQLAHDGVPKIKLNFGASLIHALVKAKLSTSRNQAKMMIKSGAIRINGKKCLDCNHIFSDKDYLFDCYSLIKYGKKHFCLIQWKNLTF